MIDLNDYIAVGQNAIARRVVQQSDASDNYDNDFKSLLATPRLIHWAIDASIKAIDPYLPDDYASIGLSVNFVHTAPTSLGMTVTVHASVIALTDHDVTLEVKAWMNRERSVTVFTKERSYSRRQSWIGQKNVHACC